VSWLKPLLVLLPLLSALAPAAEPPSQQAATPAGIYYQVGVHDCWYLAPQGDKIQGAAGWGSFLMEPSGPRAYKVKGWPDSEFRFEAPDSFAEYKSGKLFKEFKIDKKASAALLAPGQATAPASPAGIWKGQFRALLIYTADVFVHLEQSPDGNYRGSLDIPQGKLQGQKLGWAHFEKGVVSFEFLGGLYLGRLNADGTKLVGSIFGDEKPYPFDFQRIDKMP
jgi:hypothetical protein